MRILMVCMGNICRSPLAEGIFRREVLEAGFDWEVDSAGTIGWHAGSAPDPRSVAVARANGLDITGQRARHIQPADLHRFDYVFAMDAQNLDYLHQLPTAADGSSRIHLYLEFAGSGHGLEVPDPYLDDAGFPVVYRLLESAAANVIARIRQEAGSHRPLPANEILGA